MSIVIEHCVRIGSLDRLACPEAIPFRSDCVSVLQVARGGNGVFVSNKRPTRPILETVLRLIVLSLLASLSNPTG